MSRDTTRVSSSLFSEPSLHSSPANSRLFDSSHNASSAYIKQARPMPTRALTTAAAAAEPSGGGFLPPTESYSLRSGEPPPSQSLPVLPSPSAGSHRAEDQNAAFDSSAGISRQFAALEAAIATMNQQAMYEQIRELRQSVAKAPAAQQRGDGPEICVFGFASADRGRVMHKFSSFGDIEEHKFDGNWVQIRYRDATQAQHALGRAGAHGYVHIGRDLLVGVAPGTLSVQSSAAGAEGSASSTLGSNRLPEKDSGFASVPFRQNKRPRLEVTDAPRPAVGGGWRGMGASVAEYLFGP